MLRSSSFRARGKSRYLPPVLRHCAVVLFLLYLCLTTPFGYSQSDLAQQAKALMEQGQFHEAEALWREVAKNQPRNASAHANLGLTLSRQGELSAAAVEYRKALALQPNQPEISLDLGLAEFKQGHFAEAIVPFKSAGAEMPELQLAIGPEGGWAPEEEALFDANGWQTVSLGPRILRAETAAIAALAVVASMLE